jgi:hypothetical protein
MTVGTYGEHFENAARALNRVNQQDAIPADPFVLLGGDR